MSSIVIVLTYLISRAVDDAKMGITHVVRAEEHLTNSLRQCLILDALEFPRPQYAHCSLILGEDRSKLSKRHGATSVDQFRQQVIFSAYHLSVGPSRHSYSYALSCLNRWVSRVQILEIHVDRSCLFLSIFLELHVQ